MSRPQRQVDGSDGPVQAMAAELRELRDRCGGPGYRELSGRAGYSVTTLANAAGGQRLPTLAVTLAFVRACGEDPAGWEPRWRLAAAEWATARGDGPKPLSTGVSADPDEAPYRGLRWYDVSHAELFHGRRGLVESLLKMLEQQRFVAVFGASGSGKSSLLRAGLIAELHHREDGWSPVVLTPGETPLATLNHALKARPTGRMLLVVDQAEELFTLCPDAGRREEFVDELARLATEPNPEPDTEPDEGPDAGARVVIAMRADFYPRCAEIPRLAALLAGTNVPVGPLSPEELAEAVVEPARSSGLTVERALVARIQADAAGQVGALPLVSHALLETWRQRRSHILTADGYEATGGIAGAIAQTAEGVYRQLATVEQELVRKLLPRLVSLGDGVADTRRRVERSELDLPGMELAVQRLADARLLVLGDGTVEIAHEALIEAWPRLHTWLHEDREALHAHRELTGAAKIWQKLDRDPGALYRGARLGLWDGRGLDGLNALERAFLRTSRDLQQHEVRTRQRRTRWALVTLTVGLLVMSLFAGFARDQSHRAEDERDLAVSRQLLAYSGEQFAVDQEVGLLLARHAYDTRPSTETEAMLRRGVTESRLRRAVSSGHGQTFGVTYSPDGRTLATTGQDGTVRLWDVTGPDALGAEPRVLRAHEGDTWSPVFSPDGQWLAACGIDGTVSVWNLATDTAPVVLRGHTGVVSGIAFSADGQRLAGVGGDGTVRVWDRDGTAEPLVLTTAATPLGVAFSSDGLHLAVGGQNGEIWIWPASGHGPARVLGRHDGTVESVAFSPDGKRLAGGGGDGTVRIWPVTGDDPPLVLRGNDGSVESVAFSPDGRWVASGHSNGSNAVRIWNTASAEEPVVLYGHDGPVWSVAFSRDGQRLSSAGSDGTVRIWDAVVTGHPRFLRGHEGPVWSVATSRDGRRLVSGGEDGTVRVWQRATDSPFTVLRGHQGDVSSVAISPDGRWVASAAGDRTVRLWDVDRGVEVQVFRGHQEAIGSVAISADGQRVVSGSADGTVRIWKPADPEHPLILRGHQDAVRTVALSPDGRRVASAGEDGTIRISDTTGVGPPIVLRTGPAGLIWSVSFSPDGRRIAAGGHDGLLQLWSTDGQGTATILRGHEGIVWSVAFSPDGRWLLSAGDNGGPRIWDTTTARPFVELLGQAASVEQVVFGRDWSEIVSTHDDGTVRVSRCEVCVPIEQVRALADARVTRELDADERRTFLPEAQ